MRKNLKYVALKNGFVFDGEKIYVQSMLNASSKDVEKNILQAKKLEECGCDIIRVAVPFLEDTELIKILTESELTDMGISLAVDTEMGKYAPLLTPNEINQIMNLTKVN